MSRTSHFFYMTKENRKKLIVKLQKKFCNFASSVAQPAIMKKKVFANSQNIFSGFIVNLF